MVSLQVNEIEEEIGEKGGPKGGTVWKYMSSNLYASICWDPSTLGVISFVEPARSSVIMLRKKFCSRPYHAQ